jgi:transporter family-2 protein
VCGVYNVKYVPFFTDKGFREEIKMEAGMKIGLLAAVGAGCMFAIVTALEGGVARLVGGINASLYEHFFAGIIAIVAVGVILLRGNMDKDVTISVLPMSAIVGVLVLVSVATIAFAIPRTGVALGNFGLVFGQLLVAIVIDTVGFAGLERVPLTPQRILGLLVMAGGIYLVLPKDG